MKKDDKKAVKDVPPVATTTEALSGNQDAASASTALQVINFAEDAGKGTEGADRDSYAIPFLLVLQPGSPGVVDNTIPDAKAGMFMNSVTKELLKSSPLLVPCAFQRRWIRWGAREAGGGYKGEFTTAQINEMRAAQQLKELDGRLYFPFSDGSVNPKRDDRVADTRSHFCLVQRFPEDETPFAAVFALTSTAIKVSKNFMSRIDSVKLKDAAGRAYNPASFSHAYVLKTTMKKNDKGTWWIPDIDMFGQLKSMAVYSAAKAFHAQVASGSVSVAHDSVREEQAGPGAPDADDRM